jgi:hypothetical protein
MPGRQASLVSCHSSRASVPIHLHMTWKSRTKTEEGLLVLVYCNVEDNRLEGRRDCLAIVSLEEIYKPRYIVNIGLDSNSREAPCQSLISLVKRARCTDNSPCGLCVIFHTTRTDPSPRYDSFLISYWIQ